MAGCWLEAKTKDHAKREQTRDRDLVPVQSRHTKESQRGKTRKRTGQPPRQKPEKAATRAEARRKNAKRCARKKANNYD